MINRKKDELMENAVNGWLAGRYSIKEGMDKQPTHNSIAISRYNNSLTNED